MQMSKRGLDFLREYESTELEVYKDTAGKDTIGTGHLLTKSELMSGKIYINGVPVKYKNGITMQQANDLFKQDIDPREDVVAEYVTVTVTQGQFDALVSLVFNIGRGAFKSSTLLKLLNQSRYTQIPDQFKRWNRSGGKVTQGLINRRQREIDELWSYQDSQQLLAIPVPKRKPEFVPTLFSANITPNDGNRADCFRNEQQHRLYVKLYGDWRVEK
jgi:lysozyme